MALLDQETWINLLSEVPRLVPDVFFQVTEETCVDGRLKKTTELVGAHKFVLAMASDVFKATLYVLKATFFGRVHKEQEAIPITGVTIRSFKEFLKLIYGLFASNEIVNTIEDECCHEILLLCKKYKIEKAVSLIEDRIRSMKILEEKVSMDVKVHKIEENENKRKFSEEEERKVRQIKVEDYCRDCQEYGHDIVQCEGWNEREKGKTLEECNMTNIKEEKFKEHNIEEVKNYKHGESIIKEEKDEKFLEFKIKTEKNQNFVEIIIKEERDEKSAEINIVKDEEFLKSKDTIHEYMEPKINYEEEVFFKVKTHDSVNRGEFPQVGDLVWGRMPAGGPYWPSIITRSPEGQYRQQGNLGQFEYHVQYFNRTLNAQDWCNSVLKFDGLGEFKKSKIYTQNNRNKKYQKKAYIAGSGSMNIMWIQAAQEAEQTLELSRQERLQRCSQQLSYKKQVLTSLKSKIAQSKDTIQEYMEPEINYEEEVLFKVY